MARLFSASVFFGIAVFASALSGSAPSSTISQNDQTTAPATRYNESADKTTATLDFYPYSLGKTIIFDVRQSDRIPSLDLQGHMLDKLLTKLLHDHPREALLHVRLAGNREALIAPLDSILAHSPQWDARRGRPYHGQLGGFLTRTINEHRVAEPLEKAFSTHGFKLQLQGVSKIDIERVPAMNGINLPIHIDEMSFIAIKSPL